MLRSLKVLPAAAACALPGSPCGSNYHSSRAAGLAAGVPRPGAISPQHKEWAVKQQRPLTVCREDAQQLSTWVSQQLHDLHARLALSMSLQQAANGQQQQQELSQQHPRHSPSSATTKAAAASVSKGRSASPLSQQEAVASMVAPGTASCDPHAQALQLLQLCKGPDGRLDEGCIAQQEAVLAAACAELCRCGCPESCCSCTLRPPFPLHTATNTLPTPCQTPQARVSQLRGARRADVAALGGACRPAGSRAAALRGSRAARSGEAAAHAATAAAEQEQQRLRQLQEDERVALRAISERHAAKADAGKAEYDKLKQQHTNVSPRCCVALLCCICNMRMCMI
jgi:hypothetical protein